MEPATRAWLLLVLAGLLEIGWAISMKHSQGFTKLWPSVATIALMIVSFVLLAQAVRVLHIGAAYAAWTGIGAAGTAILGMIIFKEPATVLRMVCIVAIVSGVVGLRLLR